MYSTIVAIVSEVWQRWCWNCFWSSSDCPWQNLLSVLEVLF